MFSKISRKVLLAVTIFAIHWFEGHGYFFRRWESTPSASDNQHQAAVSTPHHNEYRMNTFNWIHPVQQRPIVHDQPVANAAIPVPIAVQLPQHIIPFAMFSTVAHLPPVSKTHHHQQQQHHSNAVFTQPAAAFAHHFAAAAAATTPTPFVKLSPYESHNIPYQLAAPQATLQAVRFVPCLCGGAAPAPAPAAGNNVVGGKDDRWSKINNNNNNNNINTNAYQTNSQFAHAAPIQAIHLLPCYCPLVRDFDPQYVQPVSFSSTDSTTNNAPSTVSTKS